jgi:hypothetical protein
VQLSVAPVFLLSGIGAMLAVMTNRLSRIIDRIRFIETRLVEATPAEQPELQRELAALALRVRLNNRAITLCTITALFVCAVVAALFVGAFFGVPASSAVAGLFVGGMTTFFAGLVYFLREIFVATSSFRVAPHSGKP